jgi:hypothetical protein
MKPRNYLQRTSIFAGLALALALAAYAPSAHANVYASNIKINGTLTGSATVAQGSSANITYILNEPASLGLAVQIYSGATLVRTIAIAGGSVGTTRGLNTVVWDGKDDSDAKVLPGNYTVSVTAASNGYQVWTQINSPTDPGYTVYWPSGIVVDTRIDSPYYGRVMVANGADIAANNPGIVKLNADGSFADEGPAGPSTAGYAFVTDGYLSDSIRSLKYGADDRVYFDDWTGSGKIVACDMIMSTNQVIVDSVNFFGAASSGNFSDIDVVAPGTTNAMGYFTDGVNSPTVGIWAWPLTNNGVADPAFPGINVAVSGGADMPLRAGYGMAIDDGGDIFIGEIRANAADTSAKLACITNWPSSPTLPITSENLAWQDGLEQNSTFRYVSAVAIDSRTNPKYVSAAFNGASGGMKVINATDGTVVTSINQDVGIYYIGTGWDNVGNVYAGGSTHNWFAFSPPGANQAITPAVATIKVTAPLAIISINVAGGTATIHFTGDASDLASAFTLLSSGTVSGSYGPASGALITGTAGSYVATVPTVGGMQFYRIQR